MKNPPDLCASRSCSACTNAANAPECLVDTLHTFLAKYHLRIEKGKRRVHGPRHRPQHRVKASDVFRHNFAVRDRKATEQLLGPGENPR